MKPIHIALLLLAGVIACQEEDKIQDPVYEFASFKGSPSVNLNENQHSIKGHPVVIQLLAFKPYDHDIDFTFEVKGTNAVRDVDFTVAPQDNILKIRKGSMVSDTLWITTIDNEAGTDLERTVEIKLTGTSESAIKIGLGIQEPKNTSITAKILDDECSKEMTIYASSLSNNIDWGSGGKTTIVTGAVNNNTVTVVGDLIAYSAFSGATLEIELTPASPGAMKGTASFGEFVAGDDSDGYTYKFVQTGTGTYDLCSGGITVAYDIYWLDGASWEYWYSVTNTFIVP